MVEERARKVVIRKIEVCPKCGQWNPWRKRSPDGKEGNSYTVGGERRMTVFCRRCGKREIIVYRLCV